MLPALLTSNLDGRAQKYQILLSPSRRWKIRKHFQATVDKIAWTLLSYAPVKGQLEPLEITQMISIGELWVEEEMNEAGDLRTGGKAQQPVTQVRL